MHTFDVRCNCVPLCMCMGWCVYTYTCICVCYKFRDTHFIIFYMHWLDRVQFLIKFLLVFAIQPSIISWRNLFFRVSFHNCPFYLHRVWNIDLFANEFQNSVFGKLASGCSVVDFKQNKRTEKEIQNLPINVVKIGSFQFCMNAFMSNWFRLAFLAEIMPPK